MPSSVSAFRALLKRYLLREPFPGHPSYSHVSMLPSEHHCHTSYVIYLFVYLVVVYLHPLECELPEGKDFILCTSLSLAPGAEQMLRKHLISEIKLDE